MTYAELLARFGRIPIVLFWIKNRRYARRLASVVTQTPSRYRDYVHNYVRILSPAWRTQLTAYERYTWENYANMISSEWERREMHRGAPNIIPYPRKLMSGQNAFIRCNLLIRWGLEPPDWFLRIAPMADRFLPPPILEDLQYNTTTGIATVTYNSPRWLEIPFYAVMVRLWVRIERKIARAQMLTNFPIPPIGGIRKIKFRRVRVKGVLTPLKNLHGKLRVQMDTCTIYKEGHGIVQSAPSNIKEIVI